MSKAFSALMPAHAALLDQIAEDYAGEQFSPAEVLRGQPQLLTIALANRELALSLKALLDFSEEGDFENALHVLDHVALKLRELHLSTRTDESGTVNHG